jgi:hypothetical protein
MKTFEQTSSRVVRTIVDDREAGIRRNVVASVKSRFNESVN